MGREERERKKRRRGRGEGERRSEVEKGGEEEDNYNCMFSTPIPLTLVDLPQTGVLTAHNPGLIQTLNLTPQILHEHSEEIIHL